MTAEISRICAPIFRRSNLMWGTDQGQSPSSFKFVNNRVERFDSTALPKSFVICRIRFLSRQHGNEIGKTKILFRFSRSSGSSPKLPFPERFFLLLTIMSQLFFVFPQPRFPSLFSIFFATLRTKREANKKTKQASSSHQTAIEIIKKTYLMATRRQVFPLRLQTCFFSF